MVFVPNVVETSGGDAFAIHPSVFTEWMMRHFKGRVHSIWVGSGNMSGFEGWMIDYIEPLTMED